MFKMTATSTSVIDLIEKFGLSSLVYLDSLVIDLTVTSPTSSPWDTIVRVEMAEIWRGRKVHKVSGSRGFDLGVTGEQGCPRSYTS